MSSTPSPIRRWWRRLYWLRRDYRRLPRLKWREPTLYVGFGGIGDELMTTCLLRELHQRLGHPLTLFARHAGLFAHNPDVAQLWPADPRIIETAATWNLDLRRPCEWQRDLDADRQSPPTRHLIAEAAYAGGVRGRIALRPYLHLTPAELQLALPASDRPCVAIQSSGVAARYFFRNKEWGVANFQAVVDRLGHRFQFIQLGGADDPILRGAIDCRGNSFRESAAIISRSLFLVGQAGFMMHLARAVDRRAVIVFGGRETPQQSGYPCNENLVTATPCSPCWQKSECAFDRMCLTRITPADAVAAVDRLVARLDTPLELTEADL